MSIADFLELQKKSFGVSGYSIKPLFRTPLVNPIKFSPNDDRVFNQFIYTGHNSLVVYRDLFLPSKLHYFAFEDYLCVKDIFLSLNLTISIEIYGCIPQFNMFKDLDISTGNPLTQPSNTELDRNLERFYFIEFSNQKIMNAI